MCHSTIDSFLSSSLAGRLRDWVIGAGRPRGSRILGRAQSGECAHFRSMEASRVKAIEVYACFSGRKHIEEQFEVKDIKVNLKEINGHLKAVKDENRVEGTDFGIVHFQGVNVVVKRNVVN